MTRLSSGPSQRLEQQPEPIPILYIDDDMDDAVMLETQLAPSIVNPVICFATGQELFAYLDANEGPHIILVDLVLFNEPGIGGGYDILTRLRAREDIAQTRTPIIAVTGTSQGDPLTHEILIERVRKTGADAFIHKPVRVDDLVTAIGRPGWFRVELSR
jgi:CheY-like chemotaxis protein